ncbi:MAG: hypothetical protein AAGD40_06165, partial [Pseudomonadota bacterium]
MQDEGDMKRRYRHLADAPTRVAASGSAYVDALFGPAVPALSDEDRSLAMTCLVSLAEHVVGRLSGHDGGPSPETILSTGLLQRIEGMPAIRNADMSAALVQRARQHRFGLPSPIGKIDETDASSRQVADPVQYMIDGSDHDLARRALRYAEARTARVDGEGQPVLTLDDLAHQLAEPAIWAIAAALARVSSDTEPQPLVDRARLIVLDHDSARSAIARAAHLAARLAERDEVDGVLLRDTLDSGDVLLFSVLIAVESSLSTGTAWSLLFDVDADAAAILIASLDMPAATTDMLLGRIGALQTGTPLSVPDIEPADAARLMSWWRLNPRFR